MKEISLSNLMPIIKRLKSNEQDSGAFICDKETFIKIYQLAKYRRNSLWPSSHILQLKINDNDKDNDKNNKSLLLKKADEFLLEVIKNKIRRGDVACRWEKSNFITLLYNIEESQVKIVYDRIKYFFYTNFDNPKGVKLSFSSHEVV